MRRKYRNLIVRLAILWIFISNVESSFISGVVESPTPSFSYTIFKQLIYVVILFIQCIANHYTTMRISTLFSTIIQFIGTLSLVIGLFNNQQEQLLIGQLGFIGYISLCLVILFIIQDFSTSYSESVSLIRDYWLAINLGTYLGQILAMQHKNLPADSTSKFDYNDEKWSLTLRKTIVVVTFSFATVIIIGSYYLFSHFYMKIEHLRLTNRRYIQFVNFKQIQLPFDYLKSICQRRDFLFIIFFISTLTLLNSTSSSLISMQKDIHPEIILGIKSLAVITGALVLSFRHQTPNGVINVYKDLIIQMVLIFASYLTLILFDLFTVQMGLAKYVISVMCIFFLQMNISILLCKVYLLQHNIFPERFSFKFFFYGLFRCLQFLIGTVDALLQTQLKKSIIHSALLVLLVQLIITMAYIKITSFNKINKLLIPRENNFIIITK